MLVESAKYLYRLYKKNNSYLKSNNQLGGNWWVQFNDEGKLIKWRFENKGLLTVSNNGNVVEGKWRVVENTTDIIVNLSEESMLFKQNMLQDEILFLVKDSIEESYLAFYNQGKFSPQKLLAYVEGQKQLAETNKIRTHNIKKLKLVDGRVIDVYREEFQSTPIKVGNRVLLEDGKSLKDSVIETTRHQLIALKNGDVVGLHYKGTYKLNNDFEVTFNQKRYLEVNIGDFILRSDKSVLDGLHQLNSDIGVKISNEVVEELYNIDYVRSIKGKSLKLWKNKNVYTKELFVLTKENEIVKDGTYFFPLYFKWIWVKNGKVIKELL